MLQYHLLPILDLVVPEARQRKHFDEKAQADLVDSILAPHGLLHPLVVANDGVTLISGERRLRAISTLHAQGKSIFAHGELVPPYHVPVLRLGELSEVELLEAELAENIHRLNLSWKEEVEAKALLAEARKKANPSLSGRDILAELEHRPVEEISGSATASFNEDLALAKNLHRDSVRSAPNKSQAKRALKRELEIEAIKERPRTSAKSSRYRFWQESFEDIDLPEPVDLLIADPPYGVGADSFKSYSAPGTSHGYKDSYEAAQYIIQRFAELFPLWLRPQAHAYIFCDIRIFPNFRQFLMDNLPEDFRVWPRPWVWYKGNTGIARDPGFGPRNSYDSIIYINRGKKPVHYVANDVILGCEQPAETKLHMAQKPVTLYENLLRRSMVIDSVVFDPCCGSGTVFKAANKCNLPAFGCDPDELSAGLSTKAIEELL